MNTSGIRPQEFNVLVKPKQVEEKTAGGLHLPKSAIEKDEFGRTEGKLVAVSPMAFTFEGDWPDGRESEKPQIGNEVIFFKYQATELTGRDGDKYWLMKDKDIAGVYDE